MNLHKRGRRDRLAHLDAVDRAHVPATPRLAGRRVALARDDDTIAAERANQTGADVVVSHAPINNNAGRICPDQLRRLSVDFQNAAILGPVHRPAVGAASWPCVGVAVQEALMVLGTAAAIAAWAATVAWQRLGMAERLRSVRAGTVRRLADLVAGRR